MAIVSGIILIAAFVKIYINKTNMIEYQEGTSSTFLRKIYLHMKTYKSTQNNYS